MQAVSRTLSRCLVCGFRELRTDEVVDRGTIFLAECPRCEHRWTSRDPDGTLQRSTPARVQEAPAAA